MTYSHQVHHTHIHMLGTVAIDAIFQFPTVIFSPCAMAKNRLTETSPESSHIKYAALKFSSRKTSSKRGCCQESCDQSGASTLSLELSWLFEWFDFHKICNHMFFKKEVRWEKVRILRNAKGKAMVDSPELPTTQLCLEHNWSCQRKKLTCHWYPEQGRIIRKFLNWCCI